MDTCIEYYSKKGFDLNKIMFEEEHINLSNESIDKILSWSVLDHMKARTAKLVVNEFYRVLKDEGLVLVSFDIESVDEAHVRLDDGSLMFTSNTKKGSYFRNYSKDELFILFDKFTVVDLLEKEDEYLLLLKK